MRTAAVIDLRNLNSVRGLSAQIVVLGHVWSIYLRTVWGQWHWSMYVVTALAKYAVDVFFVLSGYVIALSLVQNAEKYGKLDMREFLVNRAARIYPPLVFALALMLAVHFSIAAFHLHGYNGFRLPTDAGLSRDTYPVHWYEVLAPLLGLQGLTGRWTPALDDPLWSLGLEMWFYVIGAMVFGMLRGSVSRIALLPAGALLAVPLVSGYTLPFLMYAAIWSLGFALLLWQRRGGVLDPDSVRRKAWLHFGLAGAVVVACLLRAPDLFLRFMGTEGARLYHLIVVNFLAALIFLVPHLPARPALGRVAQMLRSSAGFSYTLYVIHFPVVVLMFSFFHVAFHGMRAESQCAVMFVSFAVPMILAWGVAPYLEDTRRYKSLLSAMLRRFAGDGVQSAARRAAVPHDRPAV